MSLLLLFFIVIVKDSFGETVDVCNNDALTIECPINYSIIVKSAIWGRSSSNVCPSKEANQNTKCSQNETQIIALRCTGFQNCNTIVNETLFPVDPCNGTSKYLQVQYICDLSTMTIQPILLGPNDSPDKSISDPKPGSKDMKCGLNEEFGCDNCFKHCKHSRFCPVKECKYECTCKAGYRRDPMTKLCINESYCPLPQFNCKSYEIFSKCEAGCQKSCANHNPNCTNVPCTAGYICDKNHIRDTTLNMCVLPNECTNMLTVNMFSTTARIGTTN